MAQRTCSVDDCDKRAVCKGWCDRHYRRWRKHGDPLLGGVPWLPTEERFWSRVDKDGPLPTYAPFLGPCWLWTGAQFKKGYGQFPNDGRSVSAHRWAYERLEGPIPEGLVIDHLCRVPACVNPAHLEPVTQWENTMRGRSESSRHAAQTHCVNGHEFTPENTYMRKDRYGRCCKACFRERRRARERAARWQTVAVLVAVAALIGGAR